MTLIEEAQRVTSTSSSNHFKYGNVIRQGVQVAIVGKPNAGKSTLLNSLLNEDRAIVSEIAGTTRDTIEEILIIEGIEFQADRYGWYSFAYIRYDRTDGHG